MHMSTISLALVTVWPGLKSTKHKSVVYSTPLPSGRKVVPARTAPVGTE